MSIELNDVPKAFQALWQNLKNVVHTNLQQGDVFYYDGNNYVNLGPGTSGQVLETQGTGQPPRWVNAATGNVSSVFSRTGAILATNNDYTGGQVNNDSGVAGITVKDALDTLSGLVGGSGLTTESLEVDDLTYTDTANKIIGPLTQTPVAPGEIQLTPHDGVDQTIGEDFTVRLVTGAGSASGYYACIGTGSTAPGGGIFASGSNPTVGIDGILLLNDIVKIVYHIQSTGQFPPGFITGLELTYVTAATISIAAGTAKDKDDTIAIAAGAAIPLDITISGSGGLDTGTEIPNAWYAVHLIGDSSGVSATDGLLSLSDSTPTLPTGYDKSRRIGWVRNNSTSDIVEFDQFGNSNMRNIFYTSDISTRQVLFSGSATVVTPVPLSSLVPTSITRAQILVEQSSAGDITSIYKTTAGNVIFKVGPNKRGISIESPVDSLQQISYSGTQGGSTDICVLGYSESL